MAAKILIVEDDKALQKALSDFLKNEGFLTDTASTGSEAITKIDRTNPDLVLLDLGLPDIQGETIIKKYKSEGSQIPIVVLTAKSRPQEVAQGLNLGADDYLAKPFAIEELLARINARIKSKVNIGSNTIRIKDLVLDLSKMIAKVGDEKVNLTKTEFELLRFLMENKSKVMTREIILNHVWGYSTEIESRVVDIYIGYLRNKIDKKFNKNYIKNKRGFGYFIDG